MKYTSIDALPEYLQEAVKEAMKGLQLKTMYVGEGIDSKEVMCLQAKVFGVKYVDVVHMVAPDKNETVRVSCTYHIDQHPESHLLDSRSQHPWQRY